LITRVEDGISGHVGGPTRCVEMKLLDVPDMKYTAQDKDEEGNSAPRGELCLRGPQVFRGYFKNPEKTKESIDEEGWFHTDDIVQICPKGQLKIVDRKKNIFKLPIGEFIAPEKIESVYKKSEYVVEAFVHGESTKNDLVGIFVPDEVCLMRLAGSVNVKGSLEELCEHGEVVKRFLEEVNKGAKEEKLRGFELVKRVKLVRESFGEHGLITPSFKLKRHEAKEFFREEIKGLYGLV